MRGWVQICILWGYNVRSLIIFGNISSVLFIPSFPVFTLIFFRLLCPSLSPPLASDPSPFSPRHPPFTLKSFTFSYPSFTFIFCFHLYSVSLPLHSVIVPPAQSIPLPLHSMKDFTSSIGTKQLSGPSAWRRGKSNTSHLVLKEPRWVMAWSQTQTYCINRVCLCLCDLSPSLSVELSLCKHNPLSYTWPIPGFHVQHIFWNIFTP